MEIKSISLAIIDDPLYQARSELDVEGLRALAASLQELGLLNPITVRSKGLRYELVAGTRRFKAAQMLGWVDIPCLITDTDDRTTSLEQFSENFHRQDLNPIEQAHLLRRILEDMSYSRLELSRLVNRSTDWVSRQLSLLDLEPELAEAVRQGSLAPSTALELRRIRNPQTRKMYSEMAAERGLTEKAARDWVAQANASQSAAERRTELGDEHLDNREMISQGPPTEPICAFCGAPGSQVVLDPVLMCWHCRQGRAGVSGT